MAKKTVVISCVTFETVMVSKPIVEHKADEVHLFHYIRPGAGTTVYDEFYAEAVRQISEDLPKAAVVEHSKEPVYDFQKMLREILLCIDDVRKRPGQYEILINISSGTSEFISAAVIAAMMNNDMVSAFTVRTTEFTVSGEQTVKDTYYRDGKPVGLSADVGESVAIPKFDIELPDENLVRGLRLYIDMKDAHENIVAYRVIERLKDAGLWQYTASDKGPKTDIVQKEAMYYQRHFINAWGDLGWISRPRRKAKVELTPLGRNILDTFFID